MKKKIEWGNMGLTIFVWGVILALIIIAIIMAT